MKLISQWTGLAFLLVMPAIVSTGCNSNEANRAQEKKARDESKRIFDAMHKDADAEIRKYTDSQMQNGQTARKDKQQ